VRSVVIPLGEFILGVRASSSHQNHDSARAGGPYATKAILQEEGSGHHGGHDQQ
jgi:hypothetical protein